MASQKEISFIKECLGIGTSVRVLGDESFFDYVGTINGLPRLGKLLGVESVQLCTTWCVRMSMQSKYAAVASLTRENELSLDWVNNVFCVCGHLHGEGDKGLRDPPVCIRHALETSDVKPFFLASLEETFYKPIHEALAVPVITLVEGKVAVLPLTHAQKKLFKLAKKNLAEGTNMRNIKIKKEDNVRDKGETSAEI